MPVRKVAMLTAGGIAPCLSSAVAGLVERYTEVAPEVEVLAYRNGYTGLLTGDSFAITPEARASAHLLHRFGGSPIGNSRVKLTNVADCVRRGLVQEGQEPLRVAAEQLARDDIDVLHTIGGDDTNITAADLATHLREHGYELTVVGLPKTIDNDIVPVRQSLGAWTAAEQAAIFARNVVAEHTANPRTLVIHEVMGRHCGWLTAASAAAYRRWLVAQEWNPALGLDARHWDISGVFVPEMQFDVAAEAKRLQAVMNDNDAVNLFVSEGAGVDTIVAELERRGEEVGRDPFGHVKLDTINPGAWFAGQFAEQLGAEKTIVQKSGYFSRSAAPNAEDLRLIKSCTDYAVGCALRGEAGLVGHDDDHGGRLRAIEFPRVAGAKPFDIDVPWFEELLAAIGQDKGPRASAH